MSDYDYYEEDEGIHFDPYDHELINDYLIPKLRGDLHEDFIVMKNVYAKEPWLLDHKMDPFFQKNEWYYFVTRTQVSEKKSGCGKKAKRKITGDDNDGIDRGNWKANATTNIIDKKTGKTIGVKQTLTYTRSNNNKKQKGGDGTCVVVPGSDSGWIMKEYMLPEGENFQELVLCKIKIKKSKKKNDHEASSSTSTSTSTYHHEASTSSYHESVLASSSSSSELQLINIDPEINKKEEANGFIAAREGNMVHQLDQLVLIEPVIDISSKQFRSENDDQAMKTCGRLSVDQERNNKGLGGAEEGNIPIALDKSENLRSEKDDQLHIDAPLVSVGHESSAPIRSEEEGVEEGNNVLLIDDHESVLDTSSKTQPINEAQGDESENLRAEKDNDAPLVSLESAPEWLKKFVESLLRENGPGLLVEEDEEELLIHNAPYLDQDLFHQFAALCPTKTSQTS